MVAFGDKAFVFGGLVVDVRGGCGGGVGCDWNGVSGVFEDGWTVGAFNVVVFLGGWNCVWVDPAFGFVGVQL